MLPWGTWGNGQVNSISQFNNLLPYIHGFNYRLQWNDIQTGTSTYNYSFFDTQLNYTLSHGLPVGYMIFTGVNAPISGTNNWLASHIQTFTNERGTWPYYLDPNYVTYWYGMHDALIDHIVATYTNPNKALIYFVMSAEGSTGDEGPYKGTVPVEFEIDETAGGTWDQFKRDFWQHLADKLASVLPSTRPLYNQGNAGENYQWVEVNVPVAWDKAGSFTHNYSFSGDETYAERLDHFRSYPSTDGRVRGEFEGVDDEAWWQAAPKKNFTPLVRSVLYGGVDILNISFGTISSNGFDHTPFDFFDRHAGVRDVSEAIGGFIGFKDVIDITDTVRFPETGPGSYGVLITKNVSDFNNRISNLNSQACIPPNYDDCFSPQKIADALTGIYLTAATSGTEQYKYINETRINNIKAAFPGALYLFVDSDNRAPHYLNDYNAFSIPDNYAKYATQYSPNTTSVGNWRVGPVNSYYGRYTRSFNLAYSNPGIYITFDEGLSTGDIDNVSITVIYYDNGTGMFSVQCATCKGNSEIAVIQKKNTGVFVSKTVNVDKFLFGGNLLNGADVILKYLSGDNTEFDSVELINNSKFPS